MFLFTIQYLQCTKAIRQMAENDCFFVRYLSSFSAVHSTLRFYSILENTQRIATNPTSFMNTPIPM